MFYRDFSSLTFGKSTLEKFLEYPGKGEKREVSDPFRRDGLPIFRKRDLKNFENFFKL